MRGCLGQWFKFGQATNTVSSIGDAAMRAERPDSTNSMNFGKRGTSGCARAQGVTLPLATHRFRR